MEKVRVNDKEVKDSMATHNIIIPLKKCYEWWCCNNNVIGYIDVVHWKHHTGEEESEM